MRWSNTRRQGIVKRDAEPIHLRHSLDLNDLVFSQRMRRWCWHPVRSLSVNAAPSKREIARRLAAVMSAGLAVAGVRFAPDGSMHVQTGSSPANQDSDEPDALYESWTKSAAGRAHSPQVKR